LPDDIKILKYLFWDQLFFKHRMNKMIQLPEYDHALTSTERFLESQKGLMDKDLSSCTFTIFDLETTGFFPNMGDEIISIGAIKVKNFEILYDEAFYTIMKPINKIPKTVEELTGLSGELLTKAQSFPVGIRKFLDYCKGSILVAHPATFDIEFMKTVLNQWNFPNFSVDFLDSHLMANDLFTEERNYLDNLIERFNISERERHHALNDAVMTANVFIKLLQHYDQSVIKNPKQLIDKIDENCRVNEGYS